ncbi:sugar transferase [uncultured Fusobacterium sp.]|uniref:sugar transferase n=1 Tax=uncultured Fusobacterium sp. TaxID=159267 RepID=UPI0026600287|nr:sugar transferase [uncultured Fusobacterium sp.]
MYRKYFKRFLDIILSSFALIILSPIFVILIIIGTIKMKGNPFFVQERVGKNEKVFKLLKFRSMTCEKDKTGKLLPDNIRLTKYGRFIRSTSLDELPELVNILFGDMSIIGPRPLLVSYLPWYTENEKKRHNVRPGLSGLAQVNGRNFLDWNERLAYDVKYVETFTFLGDIKIILKTIKKVVLREDLAIDTTKTETNLAEERKKWESSYKNCQ